MMLYGINELKIKLNKNVIPVKLSNMALYPRFVRTNLQWFIV